MNAQRLYRTFRSFALDLAAKHEVQPEEALLALARAARSALRILDPFESGQYIRVQLDE